MDQDKQKTGLWEWVKAISVLVLVGIFTYKVYLTPMTLNVDFPTLLSLLLAMFSVGLSALFYFKATETSNTFYDNTYKFTKDIAQLLIKIESGFGERLRNLDEGYSSMRTYFQGNPPKQGDAVEETKQKIESEQQEIAKVLVERNEIIQKLIERSHLEQEEKEKVLGQLKTKEHEYMEAQHEVSKLKKRLFLERINKKPERFTSDDKEEQIARFTQSQVVQRIGRKRIFESHPTSIRRRFDEIANDLPRQYLKDLENLGYFDDGLTLEGLSFLRKIAMSDDT